MSFQIVRKLRKVDPLYDEDFLRENERVVLGKTKSSDTAELSIILLTGLDRSDNLYEYVVEPVGRKKGGLTWKRVWLEPCPGVGERAVMRRRWFGWEIISRMYSGRPRQSKASHWGVLGLAPAHCSRDA